MKKLTKKSLDELAKVMPVISENEQRFYVGGNGGEIPSGSHTRPYTWEEYQALIASGNWNGGYIEGYGYVLPNVVVTADKLYQFDGNGRYFDGLSHIIDHIYRDELSILEVFPFISGEIQDAREIVSKMVGSALKDGYSDKNKIYFEVDGNTMKMYDAYTGELICTGVFNPLPFF